MDFIRELEILTHCVRYTINLIFVNISFAENKIHYNLDNGLNHFTIVTTISDNNTMPDQYTRYKIKKDQFKRFTNLVEKGVVLLPDINILNTTNKINIIAIKLSTLLQVIIKNTGNWNIMKNRTTPW